MLDSIKNMLLMLMQLEEFRKILSHQGLIFHIIVSPKTQKFLLMLRTNLTVQTF